MLEKRISRLEQIMFGLDKIFLKQDGRWIQVNYLPGWLKKITLQYPITNTIWKQCFVFATENESIIVTVYKNFVKAMRMTVRDTQESCELYYFYGETGHHLQTNPLFEIPPYPL